MLVEHLEEIKSPWSLENRAVLVQLHTNDERGLSAQEADLRLKMVGPNKIESAEKNSLLKVLLNQFISPFVLLLGIAAGLSFYFQEWLDGIAIVAVIIINAMIGFIMEFQAERSMEALKKLTTVPARVFRDSKLVEIPSEEVVPGDILFVESGDMITADARVIKASQLQTDESTLTGESLPVEKQIASLGGATLLAERSNMLYKGTFVSKGNGYGVVVHTGMTTELGSIARMVQGAEQAATPLEKKIQSFSKKLIWITVGLVVLIFVAGLLNGQHVVEMLETSIALAVAAIPEGLPIVATLALAFGMLRMARRNVIVKKLSSVETLGGTTVICTDKTGTLTQNKIEASFIQLYHQGSRIEVDTQEVVIRFLDNPGISQTEAYQQLLQISALCNTASYQKEAQGEMETGDPLEVGLLKMVYSSSKKQAYFQSRYFQEDEIPFSSNTKVMATLHRSGQGGYYVAAKGAVEELLPYCTSVMEEGGVVPLSEEKRRGWLNRAEAKAESGLRMLAFAFREPAEKEKHFLQDLTLAGMIGFLDPPCVEVPAAIQECQSAGIKVVMITGDHPSTAKNIALQLGLIKQDEAVIHGSTMKPYRQLSAADKEKWLKASIFARVTPEHKLDLVTLYQEQKMVVGMTGDGVNDAPAMKKADIGIAMGKRGTQVAQEVADMVLKDDSFSSIVVAIKQGRVIFDNIRKFVIFLLSCNLSELFIIATASILNLHFQLFPLQILFINLVTDVLPALALGMTEAAPHIMQRKPYAADLPIVDSRRWASIFTYSAIITITTIAAVFTSHEWLHGSENWNPDLCNNVLFYSLIFSQILHVLNMSFEQGVSFFQTEVFKNRYVWYAIFSCVLLSLLSYWVPTIRKVLDISIYGWRDWIIIIGYSVLSMVLIRLVKKWKWVL